MNKRSAIKHAVAAVELLEKRQLLSGTAQISVTTSAVNNAVAFNTIATGYTGAVPSRIETATITDTGTAPLTLGNGAFSIINDPNTTAAAANFTITNAGSMPASLSPGASLTLDLQYSATAVGLQSALLQIQSNDPVNSTYDVNLHGVGTPGQFGVLEPSLVQVLRAQNIPTIVGAGPDDANINTQKYPVTPDPSSEEVPMQRLVVATEGEPVTITPLASFSSATAAVSRIGYYTPGNPNATTELFYVAKGDAQTVDPTALGATSFDPGVNPFGLYGTFPGTTTPNGSLDVHYSEDSLNVLDPTHERKIRFFPMKTADGTVVPNTFVFAMEDYNDPTTYNSFINFVGIISNVRAAPNAAAGSTPSSATANNPPVMGVVLNQAAAGSTNLIFNTIKVPNAISPDIVHNTNTITINNTGDQPLVINSLTLSDTTNWMLVNPPTAGTSIAGGASLTVTIKFIATTDPPHTGNETNDVTTTNDISSASAGGVWTGTLTITSNDPIIPTAVVNLAGYWQDESEHENEAGVDTLTNLLLGYSTSDTGATSKQGTEFPNNGNTPITYGSEVDPSTDQGLLIAADPSQPVTLVELAAYHQQYITVTATVGSTTHELASASESGTTVTITSSVATGFSTGQQVTIAGSLQGYNGTYTITSTPSSTTFTYTATQTGLQTSSTAATTPQSGWYAQGGSTTWLYKDQPNNGQSVWPLLNPDKFSTVMHTFTPTGAFGLNLDGEKSQDSQNPQNLAYNTSGHGLRFWPVIDANGNTVPNTYLVGLDYRAYATPNADYQDLLEEVSNVTFQSIPPTPIDFHASEETSGVGLQWAPMTGAASYNVLASVNGGTFTQININPITTNSYLDTSAAAGMLVKYEVVAVNASSVQSLPGDASINVPVGLTAPAAPSIAQADGSSGTQVVLSWTAPSTATSYTLQREDPGQGTFTTIATGLTSTTFTDTGVTGGSTYQYQVQATNAAGSSPFSSPISVAVSTTLTAPPVPAITQLDGSSGIQVVVSWGASSGATSYNVQREGPGETSFTVIATALTSTAFTDPNVLSNATYTYEVQAQNGAGLSAFSGPSSVTVAQGPPAAPLNVQPQSATAAGIVLTWDATPTATSYQVQREGPGQSSFSQIATGLTSPTYTDANVAAGQTYAYQVIAVDVAGPSPASSAITAAIPPAPATLDITVGQGSSSFVKFVTSAGALVTIKLNGPGTATVNFSADSLSQSASGKGVIVSGTNVAVASITTAGTTPGSSLSVTTKGGSNTVNIGDITVATSLNAITAPTATLIGTLLVAGSVNKLTFGAATAATMTIGGALRSFRAYSVTGTALNAGIIGSIVASNWTSDHAITAGSINSINLTGNAQIDVTAGVLRSLQVRGQLYNSTILLSAAGTLDLARLSATSISNTVIDTAGNIGTITALTLVDSQIYAGTGASGALLAFPPASSAFADAASIANINLKKINGVFSDTDSSIAASQINHLSLGNIQFANGGIPFGVEADFINVLTAANPSVKPFTFHRLTSEAIVTADFSAKVIVPEDFEVTFPSPNSGS